MNRNTDDKDQGNRIPENDPSKAMDSKKEVENSKDNKTDQDFPGYPHYPAKEDIMDQRTDSHRVDMDVENLPSNRNVTGFSQRFSTGETSKGARQPQTASEDDFSDIGPRTEITNDNLDTLDSTNAEIGIPQNADNNDLDMERPGTDLEEEEDVSLNRDTEGNVSREERMALENMSMPTNDAENLRKSALDTTDFEGDQLNEDSFGKVLSSTNLDIPEESDETENEAMGQGDEENKYYSLGGDRHDNLEEDPYSGPERSES